MNLLTIQKIRVIVPGGLNTDIIASRLSHLPKTSEDVFGDDILIGPGGKSRNIAQMIASLSNPDTVAMISRTSKDPFGLWQVPYDALMAAGVNTDFIKIVDFANGHKYPGIALINVDKNGNRNASVLLGIINDFNSEDIDAAIPLFQAAKKNNGILALSMEMPFQTAIHVIKKANEYHLKIILDPGGMNEMHKKALYDGQIYLIKPNEHEAKMLTGITITDFESARQASKMIMKKGIQQVFITHGEFGAYFFNTALELHIPIPNIRESLEKDATGCGDQVMAALCAGLIAGKDLKTALKESVIAGTLQFRKLGIQPVSRKEIEKYT